MPRDARLVRVGLALLVASLSTWTLSPATALTDYTITAWGQRDGLPPGTVWALAQDREGYLWLGCDAGLIRFDGSVFTPWRSSSEVTLPDTAVRALLAHSDGAVWVGLDEPGGIARLRGGQVRVFGEADGLPRGQVRMLVEDRAGLVWAGTSSGLFRFVDERWVAEHRGLEWGADGVFSGHLMTNGDLVVGTSDAVYRRRVGSDAFALVELYGPVDNGVRGLTEDRLGRIVATDVTAGFRLVPGQPPPQPNARGRGIQVARDPDGFVWVATGGHGVWRLSFSDRGQVAVELASATTGSLSEGAFSLLADREGNVWAGTSDGLTRITRHSVTPFTDLGIVSGVASTPGRLWVSTFDGLEVLVERDGRWERERRHFPGTRIRALHVDERGTVWAATTRLIARVEPGHASPSIVVSSRSAWEVESITTDRTGRLWVADTRRGLLWLDPSGTLQPAVFAEALRGRMPHLTYVDRSGRLWLSFRQGGIGVVNGTNELRLFGPGEGVSAGPYRTAFEDASGAVWFGGRYGLSRFAANRFTTVSTSDGFPTENVKALVEDRDRMLWLGTNQGIVRIAPAEYDQALAGDTTQWSYHVLDKQDGLAGTPRLLSDRAAARTSDGGLWFVTGSGVTRVEPRAFVQAPAGVRAKVVAVLVDGQPAPLTNPAALGPGTSKLEIDYSALNLTSPHKTRFRYQLEGVDRDWVYADSRRTAFYTNLAPGTYRFHVSASTTGFSWDEAGDTWEVTIAPYFYRSGWFIALGTVLLGLSGWGVWRMRAARMRKQFSLLLDERMRLSREIHDTLLQSMVGVALQCDVLASEADTPKAQRKLTQLRKRVEEYIDECRQSIWDLRSPTLEQRDLQGALRWAAERVTMGTSIAFSIAAPEPMPQVSPKVEQQMLRVAQEAMTNAVRHAHASSIRIHLNHSDGTLRLRIVDDGHGFDPATLPSDARDHCGVAAMRERARGINGRLEITSAPGSGTEVSLTVPLTRLARAS